MQDRTAANSKEFSCNARPDHTFGSLSTFSADATRRLMSALPPTATKLMRHNELSRCANSVLTRRSTAPHSITSSAMAKR
jgi:hypothetical protein